MPAIKGSKLHYTAKVDSGALVVESEMNKYSYIGQFTSIHNSKVGSFTSISSYCEIGAGGHPTNWVSTSPVFYNVRSILRTNFAKNELDAFKQTEIGNDVWIGTHCMIKSGVKIADGAIIGMGSVVTKDVGPYEIWAGNPAKLIRKRFDDETISALLETKWWDCCDDELYKIADKFNDVDEFIKSERNRANEET